MAEIHEYPVNVVWKGGREGMGEVTTDRSNVTNVLSVPTEFGGPGNGTNPEELLTAAIASCYSITFGIVAAARRLPLVRVETQAIGQVEQPNPATFNYNKITITPTITLEAGASDDQVKLAEEMAHKADLYCIVTNAVRGKVEILVNPTIVKE